MQRCLSIVIALVNVNTWQSSQDFDALHMALVCGLNKRRTATVIRIGPVEHIVGEPFIPEPLQSSHVVVVCSVVQSLAHTRLHDLGLVGGDVCWAVGLPVGGHRVGGWGRGGGGEEEEEEEGQG